MAYRYRIARPPSERRLVLALRDGILGGRKMVWFHLEDPLRGLGRDLVASIPVAIRGLKRQEDRDGKVSGWEFEGSSPGLGWLRGSFPVHPYSGDGWLEFPDDTR